MDRNTPTGGPSQGKVIDQPKILIVVNVDWFFLSHRLPVALAARERGARVVIAAADTGRTAAIRKCGFEFIPIPFSRKGRNPAAELGTLYRLVRAYRQTRPDLVHHVTIKPVIYGSIAARIAGPRAVINAVTGLGFSFSTNRRAALWRPLVKLLYRLALGLPTGCTVFQNSEDRDYFVRERLVAVERSTVIRGSGVDCDRFRPAPEAAGLSTVMLAGRMLWDKGVGVFVEAARQVRSRRTDSRFVLIGPVDEGNPSSVPEAQIRAWVAEGIVEWWGYQADMAETLSRAHIVVLPAIQREGLPKVLLEAAACARPIVAGDVPGCREIVRPDVNGILVPPGDRAALALALERLLDSAELRSRFGCAGRKIVEQEFAQEIVVSETLDLYARMLGGAWRRVGADSP
jgi:glycosyltransferase involved in cell wall biosynthesis